MVTRRIAENSTGNVGGPVVATDANNDTLTYAINAQVSFRIDPASGQLMVAPSVMIDYETVPNRSYTVMVTAYDSVGTPAPAAEVTINVNNEDEKPTFDPVNDQTPPANVTAVTLNENATAALAVYTAMDPEGEIVTLSLMGDDAGLFELAADTVTDANNVSQALSFKKSPDFEMPGDRNTDNLYEVTIRASDGTLNADRMVVVKVNNVDEDGTVTISPENPTAGTELTATLTDTEGGVSASGQISGESWTWSRDAAADFQLENGTLILGATSSTYTPVAADAGMYLRAIVSYFYQFEGEEEDDRKDGVSAAIQVQTSRANQAPKFSEGASTFRVVAEDVEPNATDDPAAQTDVDGDNIGSPIAATDANDDLPAYSLSGPDASKFRVRSDGQLEVNGSLDHETKARHTVRLTANDGSGGSNASASITVTIYVTDVDEAPVIKDRADSTANGTRTVEYAENGTGPVATFTASDPEDASPIVWSLTTEEDSDAEVVSADFDDNALFNISQTGVLTFKTPRSYEDQSTSTDDNYQVVVQASDGDKVGYFEVTVNVTDMEETGKVTWTVDPEEGDNNAISDFQHLQPGAMLAASVTDPDAGPIDAENVTWKWYQGADVSSEIGATYNITDADVGSRIRVTATYSDGSGPEETVSFTSAAAVRAARQSNDAPAFASPMVTRRIAENSTGNVGGPVVAVDPNGDPLTYVITGGEDQASFRIDAASGQLMVGPSIMINYEAKDSYAVEVTAYDSTGAATAPFATVTINVGDEDEKPTFNDVDTENLTSVIIIENVTGTALDIGPYTATDPEGESVTLSLMGDDAGLFELAADTISENGVSQVLSFKESPDFEMPGDRNTDNLYEVTIRASDGTLNADRMVVVKVTNFDEDGTVTISPENSVTGTELTATLTDAEGGVSASGQITGQSWTWHRDSTTADFTAGSANDIDNATSSTYTPAAADAEMYLKAMVRYFYQFEEEEEDDRKTGVSAAIQVQTSRANQAPKFSEGASTFRVVAEDVEPNATDDPAAQTDVDGDNIGSPLVATDANGDTRTYTLSGDDASNFRVRSNGQLEVNGSLDHETKASHMVTLTANDGSGESNAAASIMVTIYVTNADEAPEIMVSGVTIDLSISGATDTLYAENGLDTVATYTLTGTNAASAAWSLEGADEGDFTINGGMLRFMSSPDYEMPDDTNGDNTYMVTVKASYGTDMDTHEVTVTVIDVAEVPPVIIDLSISGQTSPVYAENRTDAVATYTVAGTNAASATWSLEGTDAVDFTISSGGVLRFRDSPDHEMPADNNTDNIYMITVNASDGTDMATHEVTVTVTNVNEVPTIEGDATIDYAENRTDDVATFISMDPEGATISWTLEGTDAGVFDISSGGVLTFKSSPDYEMAADANTDNIYMVTVNASDGTDMDSLDVTVTVTDVDDTTVGEDLLDRYDADDSGHIDLSEVSLAIDGYFDGLLTLAQVSTVIDLYFE